jgi:hypothetical protein
VDGKKRIIFFFSGKKAVAFSMSLDIILCKVEKDLSIGERVG